METGITEIKQIIIWSLILHLEREPEYLDHVDYFEIIKINGDSVGNVV